MHFTKICSQCSMNIFSWSFSCASVVRSMFFLQEEILALVTQFCKCFYTLKYVLISQAALIFFFTDRAQIIGSQSATQSDNRGPVLLNSNGSPVHSAPVQTSPVHTSSRNSPVPRDPALSNYPMNRIHQIW